MYLHYSKNELKFFMKLIFCTLLLMAHVPLVYAQVPNEFNYQAVARDSRGQSIPNANIRLRLSILDSSAGGVTIYSQTKQTITNQLGLFTAAIGRPGAGITSGNFSNINWSTGKKFIKVEVDPLGGNNFSVLGNSEMLSVPYALYAVNGRIGPIGPANVLNIGNIITGVAGSNASAIITGTSPAQTLNLTLPTGAAGSTGATGAQGAIGLIGATGLQGAIGLTGTQGIQGVQGPTGAAGSMGNTGAAGSQGIPGKNTLIKTTLEAAGTNCGNGGVKQEYGVDINSNGLLDVSEIDAALTKYICNGEAGSVASAWNVNGNTATNPLIQFIGTTDAQPLRFKIKNINAGLLDSITSNTAFGFRSMDSATQSAAQFNSSFGYKTLANNISGTNNTAMGSNALRFNKSGINNTATGTGALFSNNSGSYNVANGFGALNSNTSGMLNVAIGDVSLYYNTVGYNNIAVGFGALYNNIDGNNNTATGAEALSSNNSGTFNTGYGNGSLSANYNGIFNTSTGYRSLKNNIDGSRNTATGALSLFSNTTGLNNTSTGTDALYNNLVGNDNTAVGMRALLYNINGSKNIAIGYNAGTALGSPNATNTISIGNEGYLNGANNQAFFGGLSTVWNGGNMPWSTFSDARIKNTITENVKGLDFILNLRPVTYHRNIKLISQITGNKETADFTGKYDVEKIEESGFLAQDVAEAAKKCGYNFSGVTIPTKPTELYTLSYEQFVVPLVKAMQEQQEIIKQLQEHINKIEKRIAGIEAIKK